VLEKTGTIITLQRSPSFLQSSRGIQDFRRKSVGVFSILGIGFGVSRVWGQQPTSLGISVTTFAWRSSSLEWRGRTTTGFLFGTTCRHITPRTSIKRSRDARVLVGLASLLGRSIILNMGQLSTKYARSLVFCERGRSRIGRCKCWRRASTKPLRQSRCSTLPLCIADIDGFSTIII
jgi:hypothetical protein